MHNSLTLLEAGRLMTVCNSCRYCEGLCAVFPAMELRTDFLSGDLNYLANLCHNCGACFDDCQFAPPHEFDVNVPQTFAKLRAESYEAYVWPRAFAGVFARNGLAISLATALCVSAFIVGFAAYHDSSILFGSHSGPGAFYALMPHNTMVVLFGAAFLYGLVAMSMGVATFWRDIGEPKQSPLDREIIGQALHDAATLRYLDGGGAGCRDEDQTSNDRRRIFHHLTSYGFFLCFAATVVATFYHYALGRVAPYAWYDLPVLLGMVGGCGLIIGPAGLLMAKFQRSRSMQDTELWGMDIAFIAMLFLTSLSGLALLAFREFAAMGILLALHLGIVFSLFVTMPYGKFVHGIYRLVAIIRYERERRAATQTHGE